MSVELLVEFLHSYDTLTIKAILFLFCMCSIVSLTKTFELAGLYIYIVIAIIAANIQVLKAAYIYNLDHPIPLGGVVFASLFLVSDIITEIYGKEAANKSVWVGFSSYLIFSIIMILTVCVKPLGHDSEYGAFRDAHDAMALLFTPSIAILVSSLAAYAASMWTDIFVFYSMKKLFKDQYLWFRTIVSSTVGVFVDTFVFSIFAWIIFKIMPISIETVVNTYIIGSIKIRFILIIFSIPIFYLLKAIITENRAK